MAFWKQARGDHMMVSALVTAMTLSYLIGVNYFGNNVHGVIFFFFGSYLGFIIPLYTIDMYYREWINNDLPKYHFWRDLLS